MSTTIVPNFINGEFIVSTSTKLVDMLSPATGDLIAKVPLSSSTELDQAVEYASKAFEVWSNITIKQRASIMFKLHSLIDANATELATLIVKENGKNMTEALADVAKGNETVEYATSLPQLVAGRVLEVSKGIQCMETRVPLGVVAAIVPFNFPAMVPLWTIPISLTMGNCVILKPSEKVPLTMQKIAELMVQAGIPPGVFQIVQGAVEIVTAICDHPKITAVTFVGSSKVAEIVSSRCQKLNKRVLALGGAKNHLIALSDCDVSMAARDIVASFAGCCGQRCMAASVLIVVDEDVDKPFNLDVESNNEESNSIHKLLREIVVVSSKLLPGQQGGQVGPLIDGIAKARVLKYIEESTQTGATVLLDGRSWSSKIPDGNWVGPTILLHSSPSEKAMLDEIFGPVLSVLRVSSWEEAIQIENSNPYGNAACIYTEKGANAEWFTKRFRAAMLGVNIGIPVPREPFSFGGLYGTHSKFGNCDITGDGAMEFFSNRIKITSKWSSSYGSSVSNNGVKRQKLESTNQSNHSTIVDKANFDGKL
eukprot:gene7854-10662_t